MYLQKSITLYNLRQKKANAEANRIGHYNLINLQSLGMALYPRSSYQSINQSMNKLKMGTAKSINLGFVDLICTTLGIDPNFLFGYESKFDRELKKLQNATE